MIGRNKSLQKKERNLKFIENSETREYCVVHAKRYHVCIVHAIDLKSRILQLFILIFNLHEIWHQNILYRAKNESNLALWKFVDAICLHYHKLFIVNVLLFSLPLIPKHSRLHYILFPTFSYEFVCVRVHKVHMCLCCSLFRWSIDIFRWFFIQCHVFFVTES